MDPLTAKVASDVAVATSKEAYEDLIKPAATNLGQLGGSTTGLLNAIFGRGLDTLSLKLNLYWDQTQKKLLQKKEAIPPEERQEPSIGITKTVLDGLTTAIDSEELQDLFLNLLCGSMDKRTADGILPSYAEILKQMCPDEARLMRYFFSLPGKMGPILEVRTASTNPDKKGWTVAKSNLSLFGFEANCSFPHNAPIYLDNLQRLGLINLSFDQSFTDEKRYQQLENFIEIQQIKKVIESNPNRKCNLEHGIMKLTIFGESFCKACKISE